MKHALLMFAVLCLTFSLGAAPPSCPSSGIVDVRVLHTHDPHWTDVKVDVVTFAWEWDYYSNPEDYVLEIWTWDASAQRYRVWQIEPLGRGVAWLDHPEAEMSTTFLPRFYARDVSNLCERVEWATGEIVIDHDPPVCPLPDSAWVWDAPSNTFRLKPVVIQTPARRTP